jgi:hypothetical protein
MIFVAVVIESAKFMEDMKRDLCSKLPGFDKAVTLVYVGDESYNKSIAFDGFFFGYIAPGNYDALRQEAHFNYILPPKPKWGMAELLLIARQQLSCGTKCSL